ncbi:MAG: hypothetical protein J6Z80_06265 [Clostridia bacterium]|nr:hypothetical protein [Clostridia bacterium]
MGFLSKLFGGDADKEKAALDLLKSIMGGAQEKQEKKQTAETGPAADAPVEPKQERPVYAGESGFSWGDDMPDEENQYNYGGTYQQYFENIFRSDFAGVEFRKEEVDPGRRIAYTFYKNGGKALVVELMTDKSDARKLRESCRKEGVPYLRFYFDHDGWWNTRKYVVSRMQKVLNG